MSNDSVNIRLITVTNFTGCHTAVNVLYCNFAQTPPLSSSGLCLLALLIMTLPLDRVSGLDTSWPCLYFKYLSTD